MFNKIFDALFSKLFWCILGLFWHIENGEILVTIFEIFSLSFPVEFTEHYGYEDPAST